MSLFSNDFPLLTSIRSPEDLKKMNVADLSLLADEIRSLIIETVSKNGGHLASNLGVVELSIALHYAFQTPKDRLIWDVGHQIYTHKILTGRKEQFRTELRKYKGIAGFPKKEESPYDYYDSGHSGTSISFALGMSEALAKNDSNDKVIAIIGDGSMTSGIAFEALNQAGQIKNNNLIIILNDNEMSISPNVGALSEYISRRMISPKPARIRRTVKNFLQSIPRAGADLVKAAQKLERSIKELVQPGMLFEEMGFQYLGPFDGHDMPGLIDIFKNISNLPGPIIVHVLTKKGMGYKHAESEPERFHGASPFKIDTGVFIEKQGPPSYTTVFGDAVIDLAKKDDRVIAITAAMTLGTGLSKFAQEFPDRFYDVGIAEQHAVTFASGLAQEGKRPVVAIYSTFLQRAYDQIFHDVCLQNLPVIFAIDRAGLVGADGPTHHGVFDLSFLRHLPGIIIIAPRDENELRRAILSSIKMDRPVAIRYPRGLGLGVKMEQDPEPLDIGSAQIMKLGSQITAVCAGPLIYDLLAIADQLEKENASVEIIDARFVKPLDSSLIINSVRKTGRLIVLEENSIVGGLGSALIEMLVGHNISLGKIDLMGIPDRFVGVGSQNELREEIGLSKSELKRRIHLLISKGSELNDELNTSRHLIDSSGKSR